jgi:hypothetical protein
MALKVGLQLSFDNIQDWKVVREKAWKLTLWELIPVEQTMKLHVVFSRGLTLVFI